MDRKKRLRGKSNGGRRRLCGMVCFALMMFAVLHLGIKWNRFSISVATSSSISTPSENEMWNTFRDPNSGELYYHNRATGVTTWDNPFQDDMKDDIKHFVREDGTKRCEVQEGFDFLGGDLRSGVSETDNYGECCDSCVSEHSCWGFTFDSNRGLCYLKSSSATLRKDLSGLISSGVVMGRSSQIEGEDVLFSSSSSLSLSSHSLSTPVATHLRGESTVNVKTTSTTTCTFAYASDLLSGDMHGIRGVHSSTMSSADCCVLCEKDRECWGFVYDEEASLCYLKSSASKLVLGTRDTLTAGIVLDRNILIQEADKSVFKVSSKPSSIDKSPSNWQSYVDEKSGDTYYYNTVTKETTWDRPADFFEPLSRQQEQQQKKDESFKDFEFDDISFLSSSDSSLRVRTFESIQSNEMWTFLSTSTKKSSPDANIIMEDVYDKLPVGDPDGGAWKQGWKVTYDHLKVKGQTLYVHVVPHSHNDPGWIKTYDEYYHTQTKQILDSVVSTVSQKPNRRFIWAETSYFSRWWQDASPSKRETAKRLIDNGQLEIVTGGWVMNDEANPDIPAIVGQMLEGHKWLKENLNIVPRHGWAIDPFGHTATMAYVLKRMNFDAMLIQRVYYAVKKKFAQDRNLEFYWRQPWDESDSTDMLCHMMPFFSYDVPHTCGPDPSVCCQFDFKRSHCPWGKNPVVITNSNVKERAEMILDQWRKKATLYRTSHVLVPLGDDFRYTNQNECKKQFENFERIFEFFDREKSNYNVVASFSTLGEYFDAVREEVSEKRMSLPIVRGDFFTYADKQNEFWSGYYVSRSFYKYQCRTLFSRLRAAEILFNFAHVTTSSSRPDLYKKLDEARKNLALFMHHDGITGTAKNKVAIDYGKRMKKSLDNTIETMSSLLPKLFKVDSQLVSESRFESYDRTEKRDILQVEQDDATVMIYNPTSSREEIRSSLIRISSNRNRFCVFGLRDDETWGPLMSQLSPVFDPNSRAQNVAELFYRVSLPSFGAVAVKISSKNCDEKYGDVSEIHTSSHALRDAQRDWNSAFSGKIRGFSSSSSDDTNTISIGLGEVRGIFDSKSGLLREIHSSDCKRKMTESFLVYKTRNSGAYLFIPNGNPVNCCNSHTLWLSKGPLVHQFAFSSADGTTFREARVTMISSDIEMIHRLDWNKKHNNEEIVVRYESNVKNEAKQFVTDENGFNPIQRKHRDKLPLQANYFPMPTYAQMSDSNGRFSVLTERALGVAAPRQGMFEIMLERRLLKDDARGLGQGVTDNVPTTITLRLVVESSNELYSKDYTRSPLVPLPSLLSKRISLRSNYPSYSFIVKEGATDILRERSWCPVRNDLPPFVHVMNWIAMDSKFQSSSLMLHYHGVSNIWTNEGLPSVRLDMSQWLQSPFNLNGLIAKSLSMMSDLSSGGSSSKLNSIELPPMEISVFDAVL